MIRDREKTANDPPKPEGQFGQVDDGDSGRPRRFNPRAARPGSGLSPGYWPIRVRDAGGGAECLLPASGEEAPAERSLREADHAS
jgi:hypothetical protein